MPPAEGGSHNSLNFVLPNLVDKAAGDGVALQHVDRLPQHEFALAE
jgi:hypothetical protein